RSCYNIAMKLLTILLFTIVFPSLLIAASNEQSNSELQKLFDDDWSFRLAEDPLFATSVGNHQYDDRLPSVSIQDEARRAEFNKKILDRLNAINRNELSKTDQVSY